MPKLKYNDGTGFKQIVPTKEEFDELKDEVILHKEDYANHLNDEMPHIFKNLQDGKTYRYGRRVSSEGIPQKIYKEAE